MKQIRGVASVAVAAMGVFAMGDATAADANVFRVTPYVQHPTTDAMTLMWLAQTNGTASVEWWKIGSSVTNQLTETTQIESSARIDNCRFPDSGAIACCHAPEFGYDFSAANDDRTKDRCGAWEMSYTTPWQYRCRLTGLKAGAAYGYRVTLDGGATYSNTFRTPPERKDWQTMRFVYFSDSECEAKDNAISTGRTTDWDAPPSVDSSEKARTYYGTQTQCYATNLVEVKKFDPDLIVMAGDLAQKGSRQCDWDEFWRHNAGPLNDPAGAIPIVASPGNHDYWDYNDGGNSGISKYLSYFEYATNGTSVTARQQELFHRVDYGPVTFLFIDANNGNDDVVAEDTNLYMTRGTTGIGPGCIAPDFNPGSVQYKWLEEQIIDAQKNSAFTFVVCHQCPYSCGYHGQEMGTADELSGRALRVLVPMFQRYGVDAWLCGHDEMMEHSVTNGTETLPDGTQIPHKIHVWDMGIAGDGLRGKPLVDNPYEVYRAHVDEPEVYDENGVLVGGGKHYGHMEVEVTKNAEGKWQATFTPTYIFVTTNSLGQACGFDKRVYTNDVTVLTSTLPAESDAVKPGWNESEIVHVDAGATMTQTGSVMVDGDAKMLKSGEGTLEVPMANVNRAKPYALTALAGTMKVVAGEDATVDVEDPPSAFNDAAFWINTDSVVLDSANRVTKWCDVRDTTRDSTTRWYAYPAWSSGTNTYKDVPPLKTTYHGKDAIYFYGRTSCLHLNFAMNGADKKVGSVRHVFLVHGVQDCWGEALGYSASREGGFCVGLDNFIRSYSDCLGWFTDRSEFNSDLAGARFRLNGETFDPFSCKPNRGRQMLEIDYLNKRSQFNRIFWCGAETFSESSKQGGDYISEIAIFTNRLTSAQRSDIERYLLKKWKLPYEAGSYWISGSYGPNAVTKSPSGTLEAAAGATIEISAESGEFTGPYVFAGNGSIEKTGEGTMTVGPTESETPFAGTFSLKEGSILSSGGRPPAMTAESGKTYAATTYQHGGSRPAWAGPTAENAQKSGNLLKVQSGTAGVVAKTGVADVRFDSIAADVRKLNVTGGEVQLDSRYGASVADRYEALTEDVSVTVPNSSFEAAYDTSAGRYQFGATCNEWTYCWMEGGHTYPGYVTTAKGWNNWVDEWPIGSQALALPSRSAASTKVTIPKQGNYVIDFLAAARHGYVEYTGLAAYHNAQVVNVEIFDNGWKVIGSVIPYVRLFTRFQIKMENLKPQTYTLRFTSPYNPFDGQATIDDVHVRYDPEIAESGVFKVPDGDFEYLLGNSTTVFKGMFTVLDSVRGWTFSITNQAYATSGLTNLAVGVTSPGKYIRDIERYCVPLYRFASAKDGGNQLAFVGGAGLAETTFTLPAGTWKLRCDAAFVKMCVRPNGDKNVIAGFRPRATLERTGKESFDLGVASAPKSTLTSCYFPNEITLAEDETVTLTLATTGDDQCGVLDNLTFVPVSQIDDSEELITNGSFESGTANWTCWQDKTHYKYSGAGTYVYGQSPGAYGYVALDGTRKLYLEDKSSIEQTIAVPEAGLYRLRLHAMSRTDHWSNARENVRITFESEETSEVTEVDRIMVPNVCENWFEREYLVEFKTAGNYKLKFEGGFDLQMTSGEDWNERSTMLDAISLRKVKHLPESAPDIPDGMIVNVDSGSRLVLNFPGTINVRRLYLGGERIASGTVVGAAEYPQFLGGIGRINVQGIGEGTTIIVK